MNRTLSLVVTGIAVLMASSGTAYADPVTINSYDISDAARSGFGLWAHTYSGAIGDTGSFSAHGFPYTRANYTGGSGTLNDGVFGTSHLDTQLFANNRDSSPVITLFLNGAHTISNFTLFSFDTGNTIPGRIRGLDVTINSVTVSFLTSEPTTNDEFVDLIASALDGLVTNQIILSNFLHDGGNSLPEMFSIGEITIEGEPVVEVPVPSSLVMFGLGLGVMGVSTAYRRWSKKTKVVA